MEKSISFQQLIVWQKAHEFVLLVYKVTDQFPRKEMFGLTSQFMRAAISIAANIVEGYKKKDYKNEIHFFNIAQSSLEECRYYIILSKDLNYTSDSNLAKFSEEVSKLLSSYIKSINANNPVS
jgi:four helix bundle protein